MGIKATGQITITDLNDINISATQPVNPSVDQLWLDSSITPNVLKRYDGSTWVVVNDYSEEIANLVPFIKGTSTGTTGNWTGVAPFKTLQDGQQVTYQLTCIPSGNATLNLTLSDGSTTGAINCYYSGSSRLTTHYGQGNVIRLTYIVNNNISSVNYTGWWADANYDSDTFDRVRYNWSIKAKSAITAGYLIVADSTDTFFHLTKDVPFEINKPILYARSVISSGSTGSDNYTVYPNSISIRSNSGNGSLSLTTYKSLYIEGTLSGITFTPTGTNLFTDTPTNQDKVYMLIGQLYGTYQFSLVGQHELYKFDGGIFKSFAQIASEAKEATYDLDTRVTTNTTALNVAQGKIDTIISQSGIDELNTDGTTLYDRYTTTVQDVNSIRTIVNSHTTDINNVISSYQTSITQTKDSILATLDSSISELNNNIISQYSADLQATADSFDLKFSQLQSSIENNNQNVDQINQYFNFSAGGFEIGETGSQLKLKMQNDTIGFKNGDTTLAEITGNKMSIPNLDVGETLEIGNHKIEKYSNTMTLIRFIG